MSSTSDMAVVRFNTGALSTNESFASNGLLTVHLWGGRDGAEAVVQQTDGIVFALVRIMP